MQRADTVTSLVLIVFGLGVVGEAWRMPRFTEFGSSIWSAPGVVPAMIGAVLALMGAALFARSRATSAAAADRTAAGAGADQRPDAGVWLRVAAAFTLCVGFAGGLVGRLPFLIAAFLFILAFTLVFDRNDRPDAWTEPRRLAKRALLAAVVAGVASFAIATIFEDIFLVRLP